MHLPYSIRIDAKMKLSVRNTFLHATGDDETPTLKAERQGESRTGPAAFTIPAGAISDTDDEEEMPEDTKAKDTDKVPTHDVGDLLKDGKDLKKITLKKKAAKGAGSPVAQRSPVVESDEEKAGTSQLPSRLCTTNVAVRNTFVHVEDDEVTLPVDREGRASTAPTAFCRNSLGLGSDSSDEDEQEAVAAEEEKEAEDEQRRMPYPVLNPLMAGMLGMPTGMPPGIVPFPNPFMFDTGASPDPSDPGFASVLAAQAAAHAWAAQAAQVNYAMANQMAVSRQMMEPTFELSNYQQKSGKTTLVLRNLPLNYRRNMLLRMLDHEGYTAQYDFLYLPIDFNTGASLGYAFVNLADPSMVPAFWSTFDGYKKWMFRSTKVCAVSWSSPHQGLKVHLDRFRNSPVMHESVPDEYKPVLLINGLRVEFPGPTKKLWAPNLKQPANPSKLAKGGGKKA